MAGRSDGGMPAEHDGGGADECCVDGGLEAQAAPERVVAREAGGYLARGGAAEDVVEEGGGLWRPIPPKVVW